MGSVGCTRGAHRGAHACKTRPWWTSQPRQAHPRHPGRQTKLGAPEIASGSPAPGLLLGPQQGVDPLAGAQRVAHKVFIPAVNHDTGACRRSAFNAATWLAAAAGPAVARPTLMPALDQPTSVIPALVLISAGHEAGVARARVQVAPCCCFVLDVCLTAMETCETDACTHQSPAGRPPGRHSSWSCRSRGSSRAGRSRTCRPGRRGHPASPCNGVKARNGGWLLRQRGK